MVVGCEFYVNYVVHASLSVSSDTLLEGMAS